MVEVAGNPIYCCFKSNCVFPECKYYPAFKKSLTGLSVHHALHRLVFLKLSDHHHQFNCLLMQLNVFKYQLNLTLTVEVYGYFLKRFCALCGEGWRSCVCRQWKLTIKFTECKKKIYADKTVAKIINVIEKHKITHLQFGISNPSSRSSRFFNIRNSIACPLHRRKEQGPRLPFASLSGWIHCPRQHGNA